MARKLKASLLLIKTAYFASEWTNYQELKMAFLMSDLMYIKLVTQKWFYSILFGFVCFRQMDMQVLTLTLIIQNTDAQI